MTEEEKEAIDRLNRIIITKFNNDYSIDNLDKEAIETVLSMLKEKDRQIDLMAEQLAGLTIWDNEKEEPLILTDKKEVKQYFERKAENE